MVGTYAFGGSKVRILQTKFWGGRRVNLLFALRDRFDNADTSGSFTITYNYILADQHVLTFLAEDGRELATFERWNNTEAPEEYEMPAAPEKSRRHLRGMVHR